ncbi:NAD(P)H-dependent glycerol-3-phosphate dehydrogenase [Kandleria sp.]|uniref:NAD(P)H-dependent glycerol-3-phosphate dehydrogenase n=1 Tax=Kandleria sp. TaxID=2774291 RepID=UPI001B74BF91|nr:NAD(P)H-dependent glycerol-3-phosphate dehydrogenase [Kandleria sp.]MBP3277217.1 NAD(P)-dependent glycerol-3-phosphate dehydrogenase [Kandleria sp.]
MKVAILGTGSWATGLARVLNDNGVDLLMYGVDDREIEDINVRHCNYKYFKNIKIEENIRATKDLAEAIDGADFILVTIPSQFIRTVLEDIKKILKKKVTIINAAKGFDMNTNSRISDTIRSVFIEDEINPVVSLIGPSHAEEVVVRMLTSVCAVSQDQKTAESVQSLFSNEYLRVYTGNDEVGAELGAAYKNVIAVASGVLKGLGYGDNARAALITRGLKEMVSYGLLKGAKEETFFGLTGLGDLIVTCSSVHSRNFQAGKEIGEADGASDFMVGNTKTVEGVRTCKVIHDDIANYPGFEAPITQAIYDVLYCGDKPSEKIKELMNRELKPERLY